MSLKVKALDYAIMLITKYNESEEVTITGIELKHKEEGTCLYLMIENEEEFDLGNKTSEVYDEYFTCCYSDGSFYEALSVANMLQLLFRIKAFYKNKEITEYNNPNEILLDMCLDACNSIESNYKKIELISSEDSYNVLKLNVYKVNIILDKDESLKRIEYLAKALLNVL